MKLLFLLSGEHPDLPWRELECVGTVVDRRTQVAVAECPRPDETWRLAFTHYAMEYLGGCGATVEEVQALLDNLAIESQRPFAGRVKKIAGSMMRTPVGELERLIGTHVHGPVSLDSPEEEFRLVCSEDRCYLGRVIVRIDRGAYDLRNPGGRAFFHPGVMMPRMARALVNLSLIKPDEILLDPFCGTGGMLIEGELIGAQPVGIDMDRFMIWGCRKNVTSSDMLRADAVRLPIRSQSVDAIVTDLPYGQSVCIRAETMDSLYNGALAEMRRVLRSGRRAVVVTHRDVSSTASRHFTVLQQHDQRVHKNLTRHILVLRT